MDVIWKDTNILYNVLCFLITENEKVFDRNDAKLYWKTVIHLFGTLHHTYIGIFASSIDLKSKNYIIEIDTLYKFRIAYLTGWNFLFQTVFLTLSLLYDILEWLEKNETGLGKKLRYVRDITFSGLVVPFTLFISSMFWIVYWIDRELVFPKVFDEIVPWWFNHCVHTNITIVLLVETILQARRYPTNKKIELIIIAVVGVAYAIVYYSIYFFAHRWLYAVFGVMTWWQVCLYQLLIWASTFIFYAIQFPINRIFHKEDIQEVKPLQVTEVNGVLEETAKTGSNDNGKRDSPFSNEAWNLKYRTMKTQIENSSL